jgi:hypothetical protein
MGYDMSWEEGRTGASPDRGYFRLNIGGMMWARGLMGQAGMIHDEGYAHVRALMDAAPGRNPDEPDEEKAWEANEVAWEAIRRWHPEAPGIAVWKLGSNDGWLVTPLECQGAIARWMAAGSPNPPGADRAECAEWRRWVDYIRQAALHGGFRVW